MATFIIAELSGRVQELEAELVKMKLREGLKLRHFVLTPNSGDEEHAEASKEALKAYALAVAPTNLELAADIHYWLDRIEAGEE